MHADTLGTLHIVWIILIHFSELRVIFLTADWEAQKNAEAVKETQSQAAAAAEVSAVTNAQTEAYTQPVPMMPVQVCVYHCPFVWVSADVLETWCATW